eukprot:403368182
MPMSCKDGSQTPNYSQISGNQTSYPQYYVNEDSNEKGNVKKKQNKQMKVATINLTLDLEEAQKTTEIQDQHKSFNLAQTRPLSQSLIDSAFKKQKSANQNPQKQQPSQKSITVSQKYSKNLNNLQKTNSYEQKGQTQKNKRSSRILKQQYQEKSKQPPCEMQIKLWARIPSNKQPIEANQQQDPYNERFQNEGSENSYEISQNSDEISELELSEDDPGQRINTFNKRYTPLASSQMNNSFSQQNSRDNSIDQSMEKSRDNSPLESSASVVYHSRKMCLTSQSLVMKPDQGIPSQITGGSDNNDLGSIDMEQVFNDHKLNKGFQSTKAQQFKKNYANRQNQSNIAAFRQMQSQSQQSFRNDTQTSQINTSFKLQLDDIQIDHKIPTVKGHNISKKQQPTENLDRSAQILQRFIKDSTQKSSQLNTFSPFTTKDSSKFSKLLNSSSTQKNSVGLQSIRSVKPQSQSFIEENFSNKMESGSLSFREQNGDDLRLTTQQNMNTKSQQKLSSFSNTPNKINKSKISFVQESEKMTLGNPLSQLMSHEKQWEETKKKIQMSQSQRDSLIRQRYQK